MLLCSLKKNRKEVERKDLKIKTLSTFAAEDMWYAETMTFVENFDHVLSKINDSNAYKDCIITGYINIDLMKYETHEATNGYLGTMLCDEFMPTLILPTKVTSNTCRATSAKP